MPEDTTRILHGIYKRGDELIQFIMFEDGTIEIVDIRKNPFKENKFPVVVGDIMKKITLLVIGLFICSNLFAKQTLIHKGTIWGNRYLTIYPIVVTTYICKLQEGTILKDTMRHYNGI